MAKRIYGKWNPQDMVKALEEFKKEKVKLNECCRKYGIPKKTFLRHLRGEVKRGPERKTSLNGRGTALPMEFETELVQEILYLEECMFGLTIKDVRQLAFDVLKGNPHLPNPFSKATQTAGKKWYYGFMKRHPELSLRQPQSVSIARSRGFNKENVGQFFDLLETIVDNNNIDAMRIYNVDESGFSTVQKKSPKIVALKGKHQVGSLSSNERGVNTTFVCCTSAAGHFVPPMIIFKRQRMHPALMIGAPPGSLVECSESGYINTVLFVKWLQHFISHVKPTKDKKVLLVLDGHSTHSKNLEAIKIARDHGVLLLQLPGHTTHRLQPLDVSVFKPFQTFYDTAICKWLRSNAGERVTPFVICPLLSEAYSKAATLGNAANGFRATGIWPVNRDVFSETDFVASENLSPQLISERTDNADNADEIGQDDEASTQNSNMPANEDQSTEKIVHVSEVSPRPKKNSKEAQRQSRGAQKAEELTSSPYKRQLEEVQERKNRTETVKRKQINKGTGKGKSKRQKTRSPSCEDQNKAGGSSSVLIEASDGDWYCFICQKSFLEDMIQCTSCDQWAHESCAEVSKKEKNFVCHTCENQCSPS